MSSSALVTSKTITTPVKKTKYVARDSPSNWKHPRLVEIARRREVSTFTEKNVKTLIYNVAGLGLLWAVRLGYKSMKPGPSAQVAHYVSWTYALLLALPIFNIVIALLPLVRSPDDVADIPLTPGQRKLLGLPPSSRPATPDAVYSTPPRYSRTPSFSGSTGSFNNSPLSNQASRQASPASGGQNMSGSPANSPLWQRTVAGGLGGGLGARRSSFGSPSPLASSTARQLLADGLGSPSSSGPNKRSSVGLNQKWLYERGRRTSGSAWLH